MPHFGLSLRQPVAPRAQGRWAHAPSLDRVAALAVGFGIWATHFVAVLAFRPGFVFAYDLLLTAASLGIAISVCGLGITMAIRGTSTWDYFLGGAVVGVAISSMHYTGIAALVMDGDIVWNAPMVGASIVAGMVLAGLASVSAMGTGWRRLTLGALLLTLAICLMHFTAMGAANFDRCFPLSADGEVNGGWLALAIAFVSMLILGAVFGSIVLDEADHRRTERERERQAADAVRLSEVTQRLELAMTHMSQGLALHDASGVLRLHNRRLPVLLGLNLTQDLTGHSFRYVCRLTIVGSDPIPSHDTEERIDQALALHLPLEQNSFYLVFQVQKSVATNKITGYEVLLRWDRPGHGRCRRPISSRWPRNAAPSAPGYSKWRASTPPAGPSPTRWPSIFPACN